MLGNKKPKVDKPKGSKPPPMKPPLKQLDDYNNERRRLYKTGESVVLTGIACPKCGDELCESSPGWIHPSFPPKKAVMCVKCGYKGTCIA